MHTFNSPSLLPLIRKRLGTIYRQFKQKALRLELKILAYLLLKIGELVNSFKPFILLPIDATRIGHFCLSELPLRLNPTPSNRKLPPIIGAYLPPTCNNYLLHLFGQRVNLISSSFLYQLITQEIFAKASFLWSPAKSCSTFSDYAHLPPAFQFSTEEEQRGNKYLKEMGLNPSKDWFVCFHVRDEAYLKQKFPTHSWEHHSYRNGNLEALYPSLEFLISQAGGHVIRMGAVTDTPLTLVQPKIIDYSAQFRNEFLDLYLMAKCKFFIGSTSGLTNLAVIFNRPYLLLNYAPLSNMEQLSYNLFLPMKLRDRATKALIPFKRIKIDKLDQLGTSQHYQEKGVLVEENSSEEILLAVKEFYQYLTGTEVLDFKGSKSDQLFHKFTTIFSVKNPQVHTQIARTFLLKYPELVD